MAMIPLGFCQEGAMLAERELPHPHPAVQRGGGALGRCGKLHHSIKNETLTDADTLTWPIESVPSVVSDVPPIF